MFKHSSIKQISKHSILGLFIALLLIVPLVFSSNTRELYEFPKMHFVYLMGILLFGLFGLDLISRYPHNKFVKLPVVVSIYLFTFIVSTIFSSHAPTSLWGYYSRFTDGLVPVSFFVGIYFVAINIDLKQYQDKLLKVILLTLVPISTYGIAQYLGFWTGEFGGRVFSTLGQPNWLAQYVGMVLLIVVYIAYFSEDAFDVFFSCILYFLGFSCLWYTVSLSGIFGFLCGMCVFFALYRKKYLKLDRRKEFVTKSIILAGITLFVVISSPGIFLSKMSDALIDIKKQISVTKKAYASDGEYVVSDPGRIRLGMWRGTWQLITSSPKVFLIGAGPETFPYEFQHYRPEELNYSSEWDYVLNKPHNYYLETWAEQGIIGLIAYMLLIGWVFLKLPEYLRPSLSVFYISNIFGWPTVATTLLFWIWTSFVRLDEEKKYAHKK